MLKTTGWVLVGLGIVLAVASAAVPILMANQVFSDIAESPDTPSPRDLANGLSAIERVWKVGAAGFMAGTVTALLGGVFLAVGVSRRRRSRPPGSGADEEGEGCQQ